MISPLLNGDPANFTPAECGLAIQQEANRLVREQGLTLIQAWARVRALNPEVYARMGEASPASQGGGNPAQEPGTIQTSAALRVTYDAAFQAAIAKNQTDIYGANQAGMRAIGAVPPLAAKLGSRPIVTDATPRSPVGKTTMNGPGGTGWEGTPKPSALGNEAARQRNLAAFTRAVESHAQTKGVGVARAWNECQQLYPALYAMLANEAAPGTDCPPVDDVFRSAMKLPDDVTAEEAGLVWNANGKKLEPLNAQSMADALAGYHMGKSGLSLDAARAAVAGRFPDLCAAAGMSGDDDETDALDNEVGGTFLVLGNEVSIGDDGWCLIAPYGEWPKTRVYSEGGQVKTQEYLQVLDNASADALVSKQDSAFKKIKRAGVGVSVFKGHGDLNDVDPKAIGSGAGKVKLGVVDDVRKGPKGVEAHFSLDGDGADAVASGFKFPSGFWYVAPIGNSSGSVIRCRPVKLISVALTDHPNIAGVQSLANTAGN